MPSNLYGVANAPGIPVSQVTIGGVAINCPSGVETPIIASAPLIAPSQGVFYCAITGVVAITFGATTPSNCIVGVRFSTGSDFTNSGLAAGILVPNTTVQVPITYYSPALSTNWLGTGSIVQVTVTPAGAAVTAVAGATYAYFCLLRATDQ